MTSFYTWVWQISIFIILLKNKVFKQQYHFIFKRVTLLCNKQNFMGPTDWRKVFFPLLDSTELQPLKRRPSWNNCTTNLPGLLIKSLLSAIWIEYFHISFYKVLFHCDTAFKRDTDEYSLLTLSVCFFSAFKSTGAFIINSSISENIYESPN